MGREHQIMQGTSLKSSTIEKHLAQFDPISTMSRAVIGWEQTTKRSPAELKKAKNQSSMSFFRGILHHNDPQITCKFRQFPVYNRRAWSTMKVRSPIYQKVGGDVWHNIEECAGSYEYFLQYSNSASEKPAECHKCH